MTPRILSDLIGTLQSTFRIGTTRLNNNSGVIQAENAAGTAKVPIAASVIAAIAADNKRSGFKVAEGMSADVDYELPAADGSTNQVLTTNGSKVLTWSTVATGNNAVKEQTESITFESVSPHAIFTPPANAVISKVLVNVTEAFNGTSPQLSVGVSGTPAKYMGTTENILGTIGVYEVEPRLTEDGSPEEIIITFSTGSGASAGACDVSVLYANPS